MVQADPVVDLELGYGVRLAEKECFDILREDGTTRGSLMERGRVCADGGRHRTAHVWIHNARGKVLVQKRSLSKHSCPNKWDVTCAGHVATGDNSRNAAVREAQEELGLALSPLELRKLYTVRSSCHDEQKHDNEIVDVYMVACEVS